MIKLSIEQRLACDTLAAVLSNQIVPELETYFSSDCLPETTLRMCLARVAPYGLGNLRIPTRFGGSGLDLVTAGLLHEVGAEMAPEVAQPAIINDAVGLVIARADAPSLQQYYLPALTAGELIAASANTEPQGGSDVKAIQTKARKVGNAYHISGRKIWITNGQYADFVIVLARTVEEEGLDLYLVDRRLHGFVSTPIALAGRVTASELTFQDVEVPGENRLTHRNGLATMLGAFQATRAFVALSAIGAARAAFRLALDHARHRVQFGKAIAATQLIQADLADSAIEIEAARLLAFEALEKADRGESIELAASMAKLFASEMAQRVVQRAVETHGASGIADGTKMERLSRLVRIFSIVEGTAGIQRLIIGRQLTGISAF